MAIVLVFIQIVGAHDAPGLSLGHSSLEGWQIDLVQGTVGDDNIHLMTIFLIVVQSVVLHAGSHTLRLQSLYVGHHHTRSQPGILTHILKVATTKGCAIDIHTRTKHHTLVAIERLFTQALTIETGHLGIPCGSQTSECREGDTRVVGLSGLYPFIPKYVRTHTMRTVIRPKVREAETLHTRARELRLCVDHSNLLVKGHAAQGILNALLDGLRLIEINGCLRHRSEK